MLPYREAKPMIVFDPLWDTMKRRNITQYALI